MLFNSFSFALFLPVVFVLYWFVTNRNLRAQNILLLGASYFFYACWDWRFLFLLIFSTALDYFTGIQLAAARRKSVKRFWFWLSICINLGFLGVFKYFNFFSQSFTELLANFGAQVNIGTVEVILPVGISFYTFHGLSYVIDVYNGKIQTERDFIHYSVFVSFFPLLVAGPIERATHLLPQIKKARSFDYKKAVDGLKQILWGLFKKVVIADQCAELANIAFDQSVDHSGSTLLLGAVFFAFQIYGDFSGYSDIALGTARIFGIELLRNFAFPYFSRDIAEFWRRWHISLSSWFRDYLYVPLGGSQVGTLMKVRNTFIIFLVSGFWHGANWTFIVWGFLNALYIMPSILLNTNRTNLDIVAIGKLIPTLKEFLSIVLTFSLTVFAWIFFRAEDLEHAFDYITGIFSSTLFSVPTINSYAVFLLLLFFFIVEWVGRTDTYAISNFFGSRSRLVRWSFLILVCFLIVLFQGKPQQFIYFQF